MMRVGTEVSASMSGSMTPEHAEAKTGAADRGRHQPARKRQAGRERRGYRRAEDVDTKVGHRTEPPSIERPAPVT